jgi:hypothetical protein
MINNNKIECICGKKKAVAWFQVLSGIFVKDFVQKPQRQSR